MVTFYDSQQELNITCNNAFFCKKDNAQFALVSNETHTSQLLHIFGFYYQKKIVVLHIYFSN